MFYFSVIKGSNTYALATYQRNEQIKGKALCKNRNIRGLPVIEEILTENYNVKVNKKKTKMIIHVI